MTSILRGINPNNGSSAFYTQIKVLAVNPSTGAFLHMSGSGETNNQNYAWAGTRIQFDKLSATLDVEYNLQSASEMKVATNESV